MEQLKRTRKELVEQEHNLWDLYDKLNENLNIKSSKKTITERIQDKISLKIEIARIYNRIHVLSRVIDAFDTNISLSKYDLSTYSTLSPENLEKINQELSIVLENEYKKLDTLSKKEVLLQEFSSKREKGTAKYELGLPSALGGACAAFFVGIPFVNILDLPFSIINLVLPLVVSAGVGTIGTAYLGKKLVDKKIDAFINLNNELGNDALPIEKDDTINEHREIEKSIDAQIQRLMIILMNQKQVQRLIEVSNDEKCEIDSINKSKSGSVLAELTYEQENQEIDSAISTLNSIYQEQETQEQSGPVLTKKKTPPKR